MSSLEDQDRIVQCACEVGAFVGKWAVEMMFRVRDGAHPDKLVSQSEAIELLQISRSSLERYRNQELISGFKIGRDWKYRLRDLERFREEQEKAT